MVNVKRKLHALVAYMGEAFKRSPWNYTDISSYGKAFKDTWWQYVAEMEGMCARLDGLEAATAAEMGARLEQMSNSGCFEVEYDVSGDPYAGSQTYTPKKIPFNLDKYHIMTELHACAELVKRPPPTAWQKMKRWAGLGAGLEDGDDVGAMLARLRELSV